MKGGSNEARAENGDGLATSNPETNGAPVSSGPIDGESAERLRLRLEALARMAQLREKAIREGMVLLTEDEINREVARRRGAEY